MLLRLSCADWLAELPSLVVVSTCMPQPKRRSPSLSSSFSSLFLCFDHTQHTAKSSSVFFSAASTKRGQFCTDHFHLTSFLLAVHLERWKNGRKFRTRNTEIFLGTKNSHYSRPRQPKTISVETGGFTENENFTGRCCCCYCWWRRWNTREAVAFYWDSSFWWPLSFTRGGQHKHSHFQHGFAPRCLSRLDGRFSSSSSRWSHHPYLYFYFGFFRNFTHFPIVELQRKNKRSVLN